MKSITPTPELLNVARRVVWFKEPADTLNDQPLFWAHVMTFGTPEDLTAIRNALGDEGMKEGFREALEDFPPGIIDPRSWAYWNLKMGCFPPPPMPVRTFK